MKRDTLTQILFPNEKAPMIHRCVNVRGLTPFQTRVMKFREKSDGFLGKRLYFWSLLVVLAVGSIIAYQVVNHKWGQYTDPKNPSAQHRKSVDESSENGSVEDHGETRNLYPDRSGKTPLDFDMMWENSVKNSDSERERVTDLNGIAASMAAEGRAYDALEKTLKTLGPGESRCSVVRAIFQAAKDLDSLEKCFSLLEYNDEKNFASKGLAARLTFDSSPDKIDFNKFNYLGERLESVISYTVSTYIIQHSKTGQIDTSKVFETSININMSKEAEKSVILDVVSIVPFSCWDHVVEKGLDTLEVDNNRIITEMVRLDPQKAIERISSEPKTSGSFNNAFTEWMKKDSSKPIEWINSNSGKLSNVQRDRAYQGIANYAVQQGDLAVAKQWANIITDEGVKADLSRESWFAEAAKNN